MPRRGRRVRRAHGRDPGRRAAHPPRDRRDREGPGRKKKFVSLCTNALLLEKKLHLFEPSPYLFFSVHLDGCASITTNRSARQACSTARFPRSRPPRPRASSSTSTPPSSRAIPPRTAAFSTTPRKGVGVSISPGYALGRAPTRSISSAAGRPRSCSARCSAGQGKKWNFIHSNLFLDFLAGNQTYHCTPWGMPTRNIFGWQKPCYLLGEGYAKTFRS